MQSNAYDLLAADGTIEVTLDGRRVCLPPHRRSLTAIRSYLESIALAQQRILWLFDVGAATSGDAGGPTRVSARTLALEQMPLMLLETALQQASQAYGQTQAGVLQVLINETARARELWWDLTPVLKQPLMTLSLLPETVCACPAGSASFMQLRRWQLQQLAAIIEAVDQTCEAEDTLGLSDALESRVLPWLDGLRESLELLRSTLLAAQTRAA